ncbi:CHAD domain-containing protein [Sulfurovum sp. XTW-4]|uniref:CHAD domain-containing protein n=1 Tax=Sulfurovum xiamenensis TaxID=3019066 RepID=A0ABT7QT94_9BACT|nr:CHAD domain-containing protein [Sulfurovum xiamenensis]MDM5264230.1 CHAD domain-containing protein [Sulfurovum xiamenensis]
MREKEKKHLLDDSIFKALETKSMEELDAYFIPNLSPIDALRVILYKFLLSILFYKERIIAYDEEEDLHQLRVNIRKSRAFLKEFSFLFPEDQFTYFYQHLSDLATQTNRKRDLDVIKERLKEVDTDHDVIQKDIQAQQEHEQHLIEEMLKGKIFEDFIHTYQLVLQSETLHTPENVMGTIEETAREVIKDLHRKIIQRINALEKHFSDKKLHKIRISLKKLRYLLEEFQHIFGEKKIEKMIEKGKKLQTILGDFNDMVNQNTLLHDYFNTKKKSISQCRELEKRLLGKTSKKQKKLLHKAQKKLHKFKKHAIEL